MQSVKHILYKKKQLTRIVCNRPISTIGLAIRLAVHFKKNSNSSQTPTKTAVYENNGQILSFVE